MTNQIDKKILDLLSTFNEKNNFGNSQGVVFDIRPDHSVHLSMTIRDDHLSSPGVAHGGSISAFMDSVLGVTALYQAFRLNKICSTVEFKINFIKPILLGEKLTGKAVIDYQGQSLMVVSGEIREAMSGALKAKGLGTFNLYPIEKKEFLKDVINTDQITEEQ